jgi:hypothetical protein
VCGRRARHRAQRHRPVQGDELPAMVNSKREQVSVGDLAVADEGI